MADNIQSIVQRTGDPTMTKFKLGDYVIKKKSKNNTIRKVVSVKLTNRNTEDEI